MRSQPISTHSFSIHSQTMGIDGGINQDAVSKLFGKGADEQWAVFFREVYQNSADAVNDSADYFEFVARTGYLDTNAHRLIAETLEAYKAMPPWDKVQETLTEASEIEYLIVADKNTTGLKGDINPKTAPPSSNFKNFFFTLGHSKETGGGAFGLGRNVFFRASLANTIFVYTKFQDNNGTVNSRFMGMTAANHFRHQDVNYTGRHWWAREVQEDVVKPFEGSDADALARDFGMDIYGVSETGTAVLLLKPNVENLDSLPTILKSCAEIYTWPHIMDKKVRFTFQTSNGSKLEDIKPGDKKSVVRGFAEAYSAIKQPLMYLGYEQAEIEFSRFKVFESETNFQGLTKVLGTVSSRKHSKTSSVGTPETESRGLPLGSSIALMRDARIIVQYLQIPEPSAEENIRGVFVAATEWDQVFRKSENLTHDEWEHTRLDTKPGRANPVKVLFTRIKEMFTPKGGLDWDYSQAVEADQALGDDLGQLVIGVDVGGKRKPDAPGPLPPPGGGGGGGGTSRLSLTLVGNRPISEDTQYVTREIGYEYRVTKNPELSGLFTLNASVYASIGSGIRESDAPAGAPIPEIYSIEIDGVKADLDKRVILTTSAAKSKGIINFAVKVPKSIKASFEPVFKEQKVKLSDD